MRYMYQGIYFQFLIPSEEEGGEDPGELLKNGEKNKKENYFLKIFSLEFREEENDCFFFGSDMNRKFHTCQIMIK